MKSSQKANKQTVSMGDVNQLPEECVSHVISFTSARDACVTSAVSPAFRSAADSDTTWQRFLPSDIPSILARSVHVQYGSKKELFMRLCDDPVLIDQGTMRFGLDRSSGKKRVGIGARAMSIVWGADERYWKWIPLSDQSRFSEAAELLAVCWLEIGCKINAQILSPDTTYTAHLIFKLTEESHGLQNPPQEGCITINGQTVSNRSVSLQTERSATRRGIMNRWRWFSAVQPPAGGAAEPTTGGGMTGGSGTTGGGEAETTGGDGWKEVELGEFRTEEGEIEVSLLGMRGGHWKRGLVVREIEIRPKN